MLVIEMDFPAGRYHATPWGRNVNEGEVEWPPSPYRLARGLVDTWKRRRPDWTEERGEVLLRALAGAPKYFLPAAAAAHTRSYLSSNERDPSRKQLIFDPFVVLDRRAKLFVGFATSLEPASMDDLDELLGEMNYLGRSESWMRARVSRAASHPAWNSAPVTSDGEGAEGETVQVACLRPPEDYAALPHRPNSLKWTGKKLQRTATPCSWQEALCLSSKRLLDEGWSDPPALAWVDYLRSADALTVKPWRTSQPRRDKFRCTRYQLVSKVLPRVVETVSFAERIRRHLMGIHKRLLNDDPALVSPRFSGKDEGGKPLQGHQHAFFLPLDEDGDGRLDHLLVQVGDTFDPLELKALDKLRSVWQPNGRPDVSLVLVSLSAELPGGRSRRWVSATPFVTARHYRKGRGAYMEWLNGEIVKECGFHGLPEPGGIEWVPATINTVSPIHWWEFIRSRKGRVPPSGYGCVLTFSEPVPGPFALGAGCHYGLGLFIPHQAGKEQNANLR